MRVELDGKVLLVTGSTQGVGAEVARLAVAAGASGVLISGRNPERGAQVAAELRAAGAEVCFEPADLGDPDAPARLVAAALETFGRVDLLVNAAGATDRAGWTDATADDWAHIFAVNACAPFFLMQGVLADMVARRAGGAIVNILSMNAHCGAPELAVYSASKGALATLTRNAAQAHLADAIRVNGIMMGWADTPGEQVMQGDILGQGPDWARRVVAAMPLRRMLSAPEVARLAIWLLSPQAGMQTGTLIDLEQAVVGAPVARAIAPRA